MSVEDQYQGIIARATRQTMLDRLGHELNEAQARRTKLARDKLQLEQRAAIIRREVARLEADQKKLAQHIFEGKALAQRLELKALDVNAELDRDLRIEEDIRARVMRARAGGAL